MNPTRFLRLLTGAVFAPLAALTYAEPPPPPPPPPGSGASSTSVSTSVTDGKGTITIIVEKDGKKEIRTLNLNPHDPAKLVEQLLDEIKVRGSAAPPPARKKMTYLGVMLGESFNSTGGGSGFGSAGGTFGGAGGSDSAGGGAAAAAGLPPGTGLTITGVSGGSPAEKAGLQGGDVLAKLDEQILINSAQFTTLIRNKKEGDTIKLALVRNGEAKDLEVTLATRDEEQPGAFGFGGGGQGGSGNFLFRSGKGFPGGASADEDGRVIRLDKDGRVMEEWLGGDARPRLTPPQPPGAPPAPAVPAWPDKLKKLHESLPQWEKTLRDAADVKDKAADQWKKQLAEWRDQWVETQEKTAADYRRAMEKMGEEIRKANEAAVKAQEDARRAIEAWKEKRSDEKAPPPAEEKKEPSPDQPKKA